MSDMTPTTEVRDVEIRSWPESTEIKIIDLDGWNVVEHFPLWGDRAAPAWDPLARYAERAADAIARAESDQDQLRIIFRLEEPTTVTLRQDDYSRETIGKLLGRYRLSLDEIELDRIEDVIGSLYDLELGELYQLLVDWVDVVERRLVEGTCAAADEPWITHSPPAAACNFLWLATGLTDHAAATPSQRIEAYDGFRTAVDVELAEFNFGYLLRWAYYHRTEFADCEPFELAAVTELVAARDAA